MFDGEIVKKKIPFKKILDSENFQSKTRSKTKLDPRIIFEIQHFETSSISHYSILELT